jgi:DNA-binding YbaB/EbfC family protein
MFGKFGDIATLLKQASQFKENMGKIQENLARTRYEADAGAGLVRAVVNGRQELLDIKIDSKAVEDRELLEELVKGAVGAAMRKAQQGAREELEKLTGGVDISMLNQMFGG